MLNQDSPAPCSVCVVIPMFNAAGSIQQTLDSLSEQTRLPDHVIVIDDGSSDAGPQLVQYYAAPFPLTLLRQANEGPASARNKGVLRSTETFIAFLDADDQWHPEKLEKQLALYDELRRLGHSVGLIDCDVLIEYSDGSRQVEARHKCGRHFNDFIHANIVNGTSAVLVLREVVAALGGFDPSLHFAEDRLLWTRIAEHWEIRTVPQVLVRREINSGNITAQPKKYYPHKCKFIDLYLARYGATLTRQQRTHFVLANHAEFLDAFSRYGEHSQVVTVYRRMFEHSWQTLFFCRGKQTLRYLYARARTLRKAAESTTAH
ncbi:glycosyltransferase family 2 protein [Pseudomonas sp. NPDC086278]|uniref:glycosyltransferase family 2 protein n=1 Tax=Pseudomonas sp. NPDC086278 TaxID=3390646 RepID=UPI003D02330C